MRIISEAELMRVAGGKDSSSVVKYPSAMEAWAADFFSEYDSVNFPNIGTDGRPDHYTFPSYDSQYPSK